MSSSRRKGFVRIGDHAEMRQLFSLAMSRALRYVPEQLTFTCDECLDQGYVVRTLQLHGHVFEQVHFCAAQLRNSSDRTMPCPAANETVFRTSGSTQQSDQGGAGRANESMIKPGNNSNPRPSREPEKRDMTLRDLLPGKSEVIEWERSVRELFSMESTASQQRGPLLSVERTASVIEAVESIATLEGSRQEQLIVLSQALKSARGQKDES